MKITKVISSNGKDYRIFFDSGDSIAVSEDIFVRFGLLKDQELSDQEFNEVKKASSDDLAYQEALRYVSYQMRTESELLQHMKKKGIEYQSSKKAIEKLKELGLLDDLLYAESYVRTQMRISDNGPRQIKQKLKQKGVDESLVDEALYQYTENEKLQIASNLVDKLVSKYRNESHQNKLKKIKQQLIAKGFEQTTINDVFMNVIIEEDTDQEWDLLCSLGDKLWERNEKLNETKRNQKVTTSLYQKGFPYDLIQRYISEKSKVI